MLHVAWAKYQLSDIRFVPEAIYHRMGNVQEDYVVFLPLVMRGR